MKITENLCVRAVSQKMNTKRDKVQKEKVAIGEQIRPKMIEKTENNGKSASLIHTHKHTHIHIHT